MKGGSHRRQEGIIVIHSRLATTYPAHTTSPLHKGPLAARGRERREETAGNSKNPRGAQPHDRKAQPGTSHTPGRHRHSHPITRLRRASWTRSNPAEPHHRPTNPHTASAKVDGWHVATPSPVPDTHTTHREWSKHNNAHSHTPKATMPHRGNPNQPSISPQYARGHDQHATRTLRTPRLGRPDETTDLGTLSRNGPGEHCTDARKTTSAPPSWTNTHRHHQSTAPAFLRTHRLAKAAASARPTRPLLGEWIGQPLAPTITNKHQPTPSEPPDSAHHLYSGTHIQADQPADSSRPPNSAPPTQSAETRTPHRSRHPRTLSAETTSTLPALPDTPHHPIALFGHGAITQQPGLVAPPPTPPLTYPSTPVPPAHRASNLPREPSQTNGTPPAHGSESTCHEGQGVEGDESTRPPSTPCPTPPPTTTTQGQLSQPGPTVPHRHPTHDTGNR